MTTTPISTTLSSGWVSSVQALADATDEALLAIEGAKKAHVLSTRRERRGMPTFVVAAMRLDGP